MKHIFRWRIYHSGFVFLLALLAPQICFAAFEAPAAYTVGSRPRSVFVSDLNGDGKADLVTANYTSNNISVLIGNGDGTYGTAVNYAVGSNPASIVTGDLDNDGDRDLVVGNFASDNVSILLNNGNGTFTVAVNYAAGDGAWSVFAANLNGDANLDLTVTNSNVATVSVLIGNGNGTFAPAVTYAVQSVPSSVQAIDFDGDGDADLAVANYYGATVSLLKNNGNGTFAPAVHYEVGNWSTSQWRYPIGLSVADFDGDGDADITTANYDNNQVSILLNNGDGTLGASVEYNVGSRPPSVFASDIDNDSDIDIVTANYSGGSVSVLLNNGNGTFAQSVNHPTGSGPWSVFASDIDNDNDRDIVVTNYDSARVSVLLSDLAVATPPAVSTSTGSGSARAPNIHITKIPNPPSLPDGPGPVIFTYTVTNAGTITMTNISVIDDQCGDVAYVSGDLNENTWLETNEEWTYRCTAVLSKTMASFAAARGVANDIESVDTAVIEIYVGKAIIAPTIDLKKVPEPDMLPAGGGSVMYTYYVRNLGTEPLSKITITGDACMNATYVQGDLNSNSLIESNETWTYQCRTIIRQTTVSTAVVSGVANGLTAIDSAIATVIVANSYAPTAAGSYSAAETFIGTSTINDDKRLVASVGGIPVHCASGSLIKSQDDANPVTQADTTVYYCGEDGKRYVFPNEGTYYSWYSDFSKVNSLSATQLAIIPMGGNVTYRPGSRLLKIESDPRVYAVAKDGVLRWVTSEAVARTLYGDRWSTFVSDISVAFFINYSIGPSITSAYAIPSVLPAQSQPISQPASF